MVGIELCAQSINLLLNALGLISILLLINGRQGSNLGLGIVEFLLQSLDVLREQSEHLVVGLSLRSVLQHLGGLSLQGIDLSLLGILHAILGELEVLVLISQVGSLIVDSLLQLIGLGQSIGIDIGHIGHVGQNVLGIVELGLSLLQLALQLSQGSLVGSLVGQGSSLGLIDSGDGVVSSLDGIGQLLGDFLVGQVTGIGIDDVLNILDGFLGSILGSLHQLVQHGLNDALVDSSLASGLGVGQTLHLIVGSSLGTVVGSLLLGNHGIVQSLHGIVGSLLGSIHGLDVVGIRVVAVAHVVDQLVKSSHSSLGSSLHLGYGIGNLSGSLVRQRVEHILQTLLGISKSLVGSVLLLVGRSLGSVVLQCLDGLVQVSNLLQVGSHILGSQLHIIIFTGNLVLQVLDLALQVLHIISEVFNHVGVLLGNELLSGGDSVGQGVGTVLTLSDSFVSLGIVDGGLNLGDSLLGSLHQVGIVECGQLLGSVGIVDGLLQGVDGILGSLLGSYDILILSNLFGNGDGILLVLQSLDGSSLVDQSLFLVGHSLQILGSLLSGSYFL